MTAPTPETIERWEWVDVWEGPSMREADDGAFVTHHDHLRHLKLAQIEVMEEMRLVLAKKASTATDEIAGALKSAQWCLGDKIAALRKEIEG